MLKFNKVHINALGMVCVPYAQSQVHSHNNSAVCARAFNPHILKSYLLINKLTAPLYTLLIH